MNKKTGMYYNESFDTLLVLFSDQSVETKKIVTKANIVEIYHQDELVGINFLKVSEEIKLPAGWISHNQTAIDFVNQKLKALKIQEVNSEPQLTIAKILKANPIPDTHLNLCTVNDGKQDLQIICGAKNVQVNSLVVLASIGTWMPNGMQIKPSKLKGFESFGMLCSARELQLTNHNYPEGIIILEESFNKFLGQDFMKVREQHVKK